MIYYKDGAKRMRPILTREEYLSLRNGGEQRRLVERIRAGEEGLKSKLVQMNYSCLPNEDGSLKGSKTMSTTVGMDIDHLTKEEMPTVRERILQKKEELGLLMLEESARGGGYHLVFRRRPELSQEENLKWASELLEVKYDDGAKDITRVFFTTTGSAENLLFLDDEIFKISPSRLTPSRLTPSPSLLREGSGQTQGQKLSTPLSHREGKGESLLSTPLPHREGKGESLESPESLLSFPSSYHGIPFTDIIRKYWELNNHGFEPTIGDRDTLTYQLACDLRHICGKNADWLDQVIPCYNGFPVEEKRAKIKSALSSEYNGFPQRLRNVLSSLQTHPQLLTRGEEGLADEDDNDDAVANSSLFTLPSSLKRMPMGIRDSIDAVGPQLSMPVITAICPCIGTLATGVTLDVHGQKRGLNLIAYIAGDFASGKLPVRCLTLNNTVANLAERLANTEGKHAFSFTPEADTVAQKWKSTMSDFSVMLRQSYDGTKYEREARSADAVNVHIDKLLWNVCMCGTPDALYRVVNNYTDGFQSRIAVARTPDNTFAPLQDKPPVLTDRQRDRIQQIAHLLPLMYGEVVLPKLEAKGREWVERIRLETMKNDDRTRARQRFRVCVTAQRMTCCLMLCKVCEGLIQKHGLTGAETQLKQQPGLWKEMLLKAQTPTMLEVYDVIADSLLENALYFFRDRIENAFQSRDYAGNMNGERTKRGKNDSIFERLDIQFSFEQAMQQSVAVKGANVNHNTVRQMLKNWRKQKLVVLEEDGNYRKL